jgi:hypothetical protein
MEQDDRGDGNQRQHEEASIVPFSEQLLEILGGHEMGTTTILDIIGAMMIGAVLMMNSSQLMLQSSTTSSQFMFESVVQKNLLDAATLIEHDFTKIGYLQGSENLSYVANVITTAETGKIVFKADLDNNGVLETVEYSIGPTSGLPQTKNPNDRPFFRKIDGVGVAAQSYGITMFILEYYTYNGIKLTTPVANKGEITTISITIACESPYVSDADFPDYNAKTFWKQVRLAIPNLRYR